MNRRALAVEVCALRVRSDQAIKIARLELVRLFGKRLAIAHAEMARASTKAIKKCQSAERRVSACASARYHQTIRVRQAALRQVARAVRAIVNINDSPMVVQTLSVLTPVTSASAVVHIKDANAPT